MNTIFRFDFFIYDFLKGYCSLSKINYAGSQRYLRRTHEGREVPRIDLYQFNKYILRATLKKSQYPTLPHLAKRVSLTCNQYKQSRACETSHGEGRSYAPFDVVQFIFRIDLYFKNVFPNNSCADMSRITAVSTIQMESPFGEFGMTNTRHGIYGWHTLNHWKNPVRTAAGRTRAHAVFGIDIISKLILGNAKHLPKNPFNILFFVYIFSH